MLYDKKRWEPKVAPDKPKLEAWQVALLKAADHLRDHGWVTGRMRDLEGRVCMLGAIHAVSPNVLLHVSVEDHLADYLGMRITNFNDYKAKSKRQVLAKMRACARKG